MPQETPRAEPQALVREKLEQIGALCAQDEIWSGGLSKKREQTNRQIRTLAREALDALKEPTNGR